MATQLLLGKADFTNTLRVVGFAESVHILDVLGFLSVITPEARFLALILAFFGIWMGTATAHELKG